MIKKLLVISCLVSGAMIDASDWRTRISGYNPFSSVHRKAAQQIGAGMPEQPQIPQLPRRSWGERFAEMRTNIGERARAARAYITPYLTQQVPEGYTPLMPEYGDIGPVSRQWLQERAAMPEPRWRDQFPQRHFQDYHGPDYLEGELFLKPVSKQEVPKPGRLTQWLSQIKQKVTREAPLDKALKKLENAEMLYKEYSDKVSEISNKRFAVMIDHSQGKIDDSMEKVKLKALDKKYNRAYDKAVSLGYEIKGLRYKIQGLTEDAARAKARLNMLLEEW